MRKIVIALLFSAAAFAAEPSYNDISARFERVEKALKAGEEIEPARDLAPLVALLRTVKEEGNLGRVVSKIGDFGEADGNKPVAVKRYLVAEATPLLVAIAKNTKYGWSLRGEAIHALRDLMPPRAVLQSVGEMAMKDANAYVQSRGEILLNFIQNMPDEGGTASINATDPDREREALAFLRERKLGVSLDQLQLSAIESHPEEVEALLAAGVDPNGPTASGNALNAALSGCAHNGGETDDVVATVKALLDGGADVNQRDDNQNTPLMSAAQYCDGKLVRLLLDAGAEVNPANGTGTTPLIMALIMSHYDAAEALVAKGARMTPREVEMFDSNPDPKVKAIVKKASAKAKK